MSNDISVTVSDDNSLTSFHAVADPVITVNEDEPNIIVTNENNSNKNHNKKKKCC